jgi:hypothetical protein
VLLGAGVSKVEVWAVARAAARETAAGSTAAR